MSKLGCIFYKTKISFYKYTAHSIYIMSVIQNIVGGDDYVLMVHAQSQEVQNQKMSGW